MSEGTITVVRRAMDRTIRYHERRQNKTWNQITEEWRRAEKEGRFVRRRIGYNDNANKVTAEVLLALRAEGLSTAAIAARLGLAPRSITRWEWRLGLRGRPLRPHVLTAEEEARIEMLAADGVPASWIAEDIGRDRATVRRRLPRGRMADWSSVWQQIRQNEALRDLHEEFAPKKHTNQGRGCA